MNIFEITDKEFKNFQGFIYDEAGISMSDSKRQLVLNRLSKRLRHYGMSRFRDYFDLVHRPENHHEKQMLIDLLTTNETYFFREPKHFDFIASEMLPSFKGRSFRCWSAACSNGAEPYSLAMVLDNKLGTGRWDMLATDISSRMLETAKQACYSMQEAEKVPGQLLIKYCLKGVRSQQGVMMIDKKLTRNIQFKRMNLNGSIPDSGKYDLIMLRNIMIYFDIETKKKLVEDLISRLYPGGYLIIGHSETLNSVTQKLKLVKPSVYRLEP
ncbi:MAG: SAM-dependent methyltransferase [Gammaproteobacteria bacterium]|nr:SAM-dependent methyltransferase [Gammaproteobacteria bacterium]